MNAPFGNRSGAGPFSPAIERELPMPTAEAFAAAKPFAKPSLIAIRREADGYCIRFGLNEAEDAAMPGPVFPTLDEAMAWIERIDGAGGR
jgi:hypothetical protein